VEHIFAKKSLGQNWLVSPSALAKIVKAADLQRGERVLELGPGKGALTERLLMAGTEVTAIEKDRRLTLPLQEKFEMEIKNGRLTLLEADALNLPASLLEDIHPYKLVANIPYYITGEIIRTFLESDNQPIKTVIMVQKEVGQRIVGTTAYQASKDTQFKESILSVSVKAYGKPSLAGIVPRGAFRPVPNVDKDFFTNISEKDFFDIVKKGFAQKRKFLKSNLGVSTEILTTCHLSDKVRAENLNITDWKCLTEQLKK
jgi:16S rRNA (adenine1518-N6/adenine1519-N6)-dimethyltransferase